MNHPHTQGGGALPQGSGRVQAPGAPATAVWGPRKHLPPLSAGAAGARVAWGAPGRSTDLLRTGHHTPLGTNVLRGLSHQAVPFSTFNAPSCIDPTVPALRAQGCPIPLDQRLRDVHTPKLKSIVESNIYRIRSQTTRGLCSILVRTTISREYFGDN